MVFMGIHLCWHNWMTISKPTVETFLGVDYITHGYTGFRRCSKCKRVQKYSYDSQGGSWNDVTGKRLEIFNEKIGFVDEDN